MRARRPPGESPPPDGRRAERAARHTLQAVQGQGSNPPGKGQILTRDLRARQGNPSKRGAQTTTSFHIRPASRCLIYNCSGSHIYDLIYIATYNVLVYTSSIQVYMQFATFDDAGSPGSPCFDPGRIDRSIPTIELVGNLGLHVVVVVVVVMNSTATPLHHITH